MQGRRCARARAGLCRHAARTCRAARSRVGGRVSLRSIRAEGRGTEAGGEVAGSGEPCVAPACAGRERAGGQDTLAAILLASPMPCLPVGSHGASTGSRAVLAGARMLADNALRSGHRFRAAMSRAIVPSAFLLLPMRSPRSRVLRPRAATEQRKCWAIARCARGRPRCTRSCFRCAPDAHRLRSRCAQRPRRVGATLPVALSRPSTAALAFFIRYSYATSCLQSPVRARPVFGLWGSRRATRDSPARAFHAQRPRTGVLYVNRYATTHARARTRERRVGRTHG